MGWKKGNEYFSSQENEAWRSYDNLQSEADIYKERAERFEAANEYLWDRENLRDIDRNGDPQDQEQFSGNPSRWFKGNK